MKKALLFTLYFTIGIVITSYSQYAIFFCDKLEYNVYNKYTEKWVEVAEEYEQNTIKFYDEYLVHENKEMKGTYTLLSVRKIEETGMSVFKVVSHLGNTFEWALDKDGSRIVFFYTDNDDGLFKNIEFFIYHKQLLNNN